MAAGTFNDGDLLSLVRGILNGNAAIITANEVKLATVEDNAAADQDAVDVPFDPLLVTSWPTSVTDVQTALDYLIQNSTVNPNLVQEINSIPGPVVSLVAVNIPSTPTGGTSVTATDVQGHLDELSNAVFGGDSVAVAADEVTFNNGPSGMGANNVQDAIDEVDGRVDVLEAAPAGGVQSVNAMTGAVTLNAVDIPYDNSTSGLAATDVKTAIDVIVTLGLTILSDASFITYDNTTSGMTATNVKAAIDENDGRLDVLEAASPLSDPMTTRGDIIYRNPANTTDRLPIGTAGQVLTSDGTDVSWAAAAASPNTIYSADDSLVSNRTVTCTGFNLTFLNAAILNGTANTAIGWTGLGAATVGMSADSGPLLLTSTTGAVTLQGGGDVTVGATGTNELRITTPGLVATSASVGDVLTLANATTGECEWQAPSVVITNVTQTTDYTITAPGTYIVDNTGADIDVIPPAAASFPGELINIKKLSTNPDNITINPPGAETIDGAADVTLTTQYSSITFVSDGTQYWIL